METKEENLNIEETGVEVSPLNEEKKLEAVISIVEEKVGRLYGLTRDELREKLIVISGGELKVIEKE